MVTGNLKCGKLFSWMVSKSINYFTLLKGEARTREIRLDLGQINVRCNYPHTDEDDSTILFTDVDVNNDIINEGYCHQ